MTYTKDKLIHNQSLSSMYKFMVKQGSEDDIRAKFYSIAFQIVYDEEHEVAEWKVVDYQFAGETPYY